jgi:hypothetical protein
MVITVGNRGSLPFYFGSITSSGFFSRTHDCGTQLPAHFTCHINVTFAPQAVGTIQGAITITNDIGSVGPVISLSGVGTLPLTLSPSSLNFGTVTIGNTSASKSVALTTRTSTSVTLSSISTTGDYHQVNGCPASLGAGASCVINVFYHPTIVGSVPGALNVAASSATPPVGLLGTGSGSATSHVSFSSKTLSFGNKEAGTASGTKTVTLTNNSSSTSLTVSSVAVSRAYTGSNTCAGKLLSPGASCSVGVSFDPAATFAPVPYPGAVTVFDSDPTTPQVIGLSGTGVAPVAASPSTLSFGNVLVNHTSAAKTVTLTNYHSTSETLSLVASGFFGLQSNGCSGLLPAGGTCTFKVVFAPKTVSCINGAVTFKFTIAGFPHSQVVSLSGCGVTSLSSVDGDTVHVEETSPQPAAGSQQLSPEEGLPAVEEQESSETADTHK